MRTQGSVGKSIHAAVLEKSIYLNWTNNIFWLPSYFPHPYNECCKFYNGEACIFAIIIGPRPYTYYHFVHHDGSITQSTQTYTYDK